MKPFLLITLILPIGALPLMSQTLPEYSRHDSSRLSYNTISFGWMSGTSVMADIANQGGSSSSIVGSSSIKYKSANYDNRYSAVAIGISRTVQLDRENSISFGINAFAGNHHESFNIFKKVAGPTIFTNGDQQFSYYGVHPYFQLDGKQFGVGVGLHFGQLGYINYPAGTYQSAERSSVNQFRSYPSIDIRVGDLAKVFVEYKLANQFPSSFPALNHQLGVGFGFHKRNGTAIRIGMASNAGFFLAPSVSVGRHIVLESYLGGGPGFFFFSYRSLENFIGSVSMHYKFNKKEKAIATKRMK
jgi:hypothetical protein